MIPYDVMPQPRPYDYEDDVALYDGDYDSAYDEVLEPDEDFYNAISAEEFKRLAIEMVKRVHEQYGKK